MSQANTIVTDAAALETALGLCRGVYQTAVVMGYAALSGADLRGKASRYSTRYAGSRRALLARLLAAGVGREQVGSHGKRVLVIGPVAA